MTIKGLPIEIRDKRTEKRYFVDNTIIRDYGPVLGPYGIAAYNALCLHADVNTQEGFPTDELIAYESGMSPRQAIKILKLLDDLGLVHRQRTRSSSIYTLLNPPPAPAHESYDDWRKRLKLPERHVVHPRSAQGAPLEVHEVHPNNPQGTSPKEQTSYSAAPSRGLPPSSDLEESTVPFQAKDQVIESNGQEEEQLGLSDLETFVIDKILEEARKTDPGVKFSKSQIVKLQKAFAGHKAKGDTLSKSLLEWMVEDCGKKAHGRHVVHFVINRLDKWNVEALEDQKFKREYGHYRPEGRRHGLRSIL